MRVKPSEFLHALWPERFKLSLLGVARYENDMIEVRWDGEQNWSWYSEREIEIVERIDGEGK